MRLPPSPADWSQKNDWPHGEVDASTHGDERGHVALKGLDCPSGCQLCAVVTTGAAHNEPIDDAVLAHVGLDVLVLVRSASREVLVAPTDHVATLAGVPAPKMGALLAALRRVATVVQPGEGRVKIEPVKEFVGAEGHIRFRVTPDQSDEDRALFTDVEGLIRRLTEVLT